MAKITEIQKLAENAVNNISDTSDDWKHFLDTSARLYKYNFESQVLIHAQRPDATACTTLENWNKYLNRWVKKGSKGIAVFDTDGSKTKLRYLFDLSDTKTGWYGADQAEPKRWELRPDLHGEEVYKELINVYGDFGGSLEEQLVGVVTDLVGNYNDEGGVSPKETDLLVVTVLYSIGQRCGIDVKIDEGKFDSIAQLDKARVPEIGAIASRTSKNVLQSVEQAVKRRNLEIKRSKQRGDDREKESGNELQMGRGLLDPGRESARAGGIREVRPNAPELSQRGKTERIQPVALVGRAERAVGGESSESREDDGGSNSGGSEEEPGPGQSGKSTGMGAIHEQSSSYGGGGSDKRGDIRELERHDEKQAPSPDVQKISNKSQGEGAGNVGQRSLFATEEEQIEAIEFSMPVALESSETAEFTPILDDLATNETGQGDFREAVTPIDYRIINDDLGRVGPKTRYKNNVEAIKTLKAIEDEGRYATPSEQEILARYTGWGAIPQVFDSEKADWKKEYAELGDLLTDEEYRSARSSTLNAHYTSPAVVRSIYETLERLGFRGGTILEPSMGTGNFLGMLPESMRGSHLTGVELDSISGRISKQLYQTADVKIMGYEKAPIPDSFFDVAIGNIPFGQYKIPDKKYPQNMLIHDYFFARTLDKVRPGGVVAFITSKGTLDKTDPSVRRYFAQRADLLGAVRLPSNAFAQNAGTEVTTDIIFLQRRSELRVNDPEWVFTGVNADGITINQYYLNHPEMMLGTMVQGKNMYGNDTETSCEPREGANLPDQLMFAMSNIDGNIISIDIDDVASEDAVRTSIPADPNIKNYSYTIKGGEIYYRENGLMYIPDLSGNAKERVAGMIEIRDCLREVMDYQLNNYSDEEIQVKQSELNTLYDNFTGKYGVIGSRGNSLAFRKDDSYYLLCSLEILNEDHQLERKADIFTKRTISKSRPIEHAETSGEALILSISEKACVDMDYMQTLTGFTESKIFADLRGVIFINPANPMDADGRTIYEPMDGYLSGDVRKKLMEARKASKIDDKYNVNVTALEQVQPKNITASEIEVRLGATWIDTKYIRQFILETIDPGPSARRVIGVSHAQVDSSWYIDGKNADFGNINAVSTYGTQRANAYKIIEDSLNLRDVRVYDPNPIKEGGRVINYEETLLAQEKQKLIKHKFQEWVFRDPVRREALVEKYNELYNSTKVREFHGDHLTFPGMNPEIVLRKHQKDAIARVLYGGNTLLAHEVGAGKTYEIAAAAIESKRLGLCRKSIIVVPNHLTMQMGADFLRLYPRANILVTAKTDFEAKNRKRFCGKIATGDYDAIIIGHSQFEKIPVSEERQAKFIQFQIDEITEGLDQMKEERSGSKFSVKQMEKTKKSLEARLETLLNAKVRDDVVTFEQLGVDRMFIDEAHNYKNLMLYTKMRNVAGLSQTDAQKSSDMYMKCQYMDEVTGGKGVVMATGTPVSNSMTELYTNMRYLQGSTLKEKGLANFDAWASCFGETVTGIELAPEGTGYRAKTRFARFFNMPELMKLFAEIADIKTVDMMDNIQRPEAIFHNVSVPATPIQDAFVKSLSQRASDVRDKVVTPNVDNMLKITSDGRKIGLDPRLMDDMVPDNAQTKVNVCMRTIYDIWDQTREKKSTQLLFCDFSTPSEGKFNVYDDIREKLISKGIPSDEIAYIHEANTDVQKKELFAKVRAGKVRVLMGSTQKMGAGTNIQDKLKAIHHLDAPWRPSDLTQRDGRGVRHGNENKQVDIYRYVTENTFDAYLYQMLEHKQRFISQIMTSKTPVRSCEDIDEATLSFAEVKALCTGNPLIKEKMTLDMDVQKLKIAKASFQSNQYDLEDKILKTYPAAIADATETIESYRQDVEHLVRHTQDDNKEKFSGMTIGGARYEKKEDAGKALLDVIKSSDEHVKEVGQYRGFDMHTYYDAFAVSQMMTLKRRGAVKGHKISLGSDAHGNITRLNNGLSGIPGKLGEKEKVLEFTIKQLESAKEELGKPFAREEEYQAKVARLAELDTLLDMDNIASSKDKSGDWKKEIEALNLMENPQVITDQKPGTYEGEILHVANDFVAQKIDRKTIVLIDTKKLPEKLLVGQKIRVTLPKNGIGEIKHASKQVLGH